MRILIPGLLSFFLLSCLHFQKIDSLQRKSGEFSYQEIDGLNIHFRDSQAMEKPVLLLVHGYSSSMAVWNSNFEALKKEFRVIAVDLKGFGDSDKLSGDYSQFAHSKILLKLLERLKVDEFHLAAHSWGASVALSMALKAPKRVKSLILMSAWCYSDQLPVFMRLSKMPYLGELLYQLYYDQQPELRISMAFYDQSFVSAKFLKSIKKKIRREGSRAAAWATAKGQLFNPFENNYSKIKRPSLLIWGKEDRVSGIETAERLEKDLKNSELYILANSGHFPMIEKANKVNNLIVSFLKKVEEQK